MAQDPTWHDVANDDDTAAHTTFSMSDLPDLRDSTQDEDDALAKNRAEFTTVYDIIDEMEALVDDAKGSMFAPHVVKIDREEFMDRLERLKSMLPVQLERASALMREAENRLESAQSQANVIITSAQGRAEDMVREAKEQAVLAADREQVTELARQKARAILDRAQSKSDHLTQGADAYCIEVMESLQEQLAKFDHDLKGGLKVLKDRQKNARKDLPQLDAQDYQLD